VGSRVEGGGAPDEELEAVGRVTVMKEGYSVEGEGGEREEVSSISAAEGSRKGGRGG
jgi:hypothetical protein